MSYKSVLLESPEAVLKLADALSRTSLRPCVGLREVLCEIELAARYEMPLADLQNAIVWGEEGRYWFRGAFLSALVARDRRFAPLTVEEVGTLADRTYKVRLHSAREGIACVGPWAHFSDVTAEDISANSAWARKPRECMYYRALTAFIRLHAPNLICGLSFEHDESAPTAGALPVASVMPAERAVLPPPVAPIPPPKLPEAKAEAGNEKRGDRPAKKPRAAKAAKKAAGSTIEPPAPSQPLIKPEALPSSPPPPPATKPDRAAALIPEAAPPRLPAVSPVSASTNGAAVSTRPTAPRVLPEARGIEILGL